MSVDGQKQEAVVGRKFSAIGILDWAPWDLAVYSDSSQDPHPVQPCPWGPGKMRIQREA